MQEINDSQMATKSISDERVYIYLSRRNFIACAAPPLKFLWLSRIPAEIVNFISQPNIFRRNVGAHGNLINYYIIPSNVKSANTVH